MDNPFMVFTVVFVLLIIGLFVIPFPLFIVLMIIGGFIAGWIHEGKRIEQEELNEEDERRREYEE